MNATHPIFRSIFERICPHEVRITVGYPNPNDDALLDWFTVWLNRGEAARVLRNARRRKFRIERSTLGYEITGPVHPSWQYS